MPVQFIHDADGKPVYAVIPIDEYSKMKDAYVTGESPSTQESLLSADLLYITLPHGGPDARIDMRQFVEAWLSRGTSFVALPMPVNKRRQVYSKFIGNGLNTLDPILRRCFLPDRSPYANTMQATNAVVDALEQTGVFTRTVEGYDGFYRPVQCIRINEEKAREFLQVHGQPKERLDPSLFILP
ncbi:hypothetical protein [Burkholderia sp. BCC1644]|uniref:hypothetical protein n=1 Tax=Burkholderia sp. BCC1644 TaxID=2676293 RepID=UPI001592397A|nr:hypothetical protein [Burkholderia sp. BCC1644]